MAARPTTTLGEVRRDRARERCVRRARELAEECTRLEGRSFNSSEALALLVPLLSGRGEWEKGDEEAEGEKGSDVVEEEKEEEGILLEGERALKGTTEDEEVCNFAGEESKRDVERRVGGRA